MKITTVKTQDAMCILAATAILEKMNSNHRVNCAFTTNSVPSRIYELVIEHLRESTDCSNFHVYTSDGGPLENSDHTTTYNELKEKFCVPATIKEENIHEITKENYASFDQQIEEAGGLDLIVLGLGSDGHFCGNMPQSTSFDSLSYEVEIKPEYPWYDVFADIYSKYGQAVPRSFVTMGPLSVLKAKEILLIVHGSNKAEALAKMLKGPLTEACPASILRRHSTITVLADEEAAKLIS
ncbi:6-phosphogluconolactonase [Enterococcus sp. AZ196]|uniref:6-phosphogluconolactonase n=1 Tax=Enterococcus sp. AZ196 TaxID=2774659 RepID=UPI003D291F7D